MKNIEVAILRLLKENNLTYNEIYKELSKDFTEREVKETIWDLLLENKIKPDRLWKLKINR